MAPFPKGGVDGDQILDTDVLRRVARAVAGALWLGATLWGALVCLSIAFLSTSTFFGEPPTDEMWREGAVFSIGAAIVAAAGPVGVWFFHRRRGWLLATAGLASVGIIYAAYILFTFGLR